MPSPFEMSTTNGASIALGNSSYMPSFRCRSSSGTSNTYESIKSWSSDTKVSPYRRDLRTLLYDHPLCKFNR
ncbi:hypothetical protein Sjap_011313 [Stephania japonica]|uniref:Uncharacterized protein n=1 Tax=Stephania japonica TaxID=461633 RepID=A0AAP0P7Z9_9MAGN